MRLKKILSYKLLKRYRRVCLMLIRLVTEASIYQSTFSLVHDSISNLQKKVMEMHLAEDVQDNSNNANISSTVLTTKVPRGFKKRISVRGSKRLKNWVELQPKQRKANHKTIE